MANKIHLRQGVNGTTACASKGTTRDGKVIKNSRMSYKTIPFSCTVLAEDFRAIPAADRCAHCCDRFTPMMNARRKLKGLPPYKDAMTKELA